ncbi:MAG: hypothetical protein C0478_09450 [Planctomyces sp.]|nr:hypothetical protein [Planctomyces sp.]
MKSDWFTGTARSYWLVAGILALGWVEDVVLAQVESTVPTYHGEVAALIEKHCLGCHREGGLAPFALGDFANVRTHARTMRQVMDNRSMPPWQPSDRGLAFQGARRMSPAELDLFSRWVDVGLPPGKGADLDEDGVGTIHLAAHSSAVHHPNSIGLGEPDQVLEMPTAFEVPAEGEDIYLYVPIPTGWTSDRWIKAVEFEPGTSAVVHHASFMADTSGRARQLDATSSELGYRRFGGSGFAPSSTLGGWAPGASAVAFPDGVARKVHAGADLVLQLHYHPTGRVEHDRSKLKIHFANKPVSRQVVELLVANFDLRIPAHAANHQHVAEYVLPVDVTLYGIAPHAHLIASSLLVEAIDFETGTTPLIEIPRWNMDWQQVYQPVKPLTLRGGTKLRVTFTYDNSESNPRNPHRPPRAVSWGEQTSDEMGVVFFDVTTATQEQLKFLQWHSQNRLNASQEEAARAKK